ncbi:hypothetical protein ALC53_13527 [Atta colombica]|uniref:Uncharacterized protein n=1 Tax=Atta colombica TaxID=520822 RepID=A0A195AVF6_9HYME|nr:hypothetical protein ALC53_13527 [Atta colombica]
MSISMAEGAGELGRRRVYPNSMGLWPHPITPVTPARPLKHPNSLRHFQCDLKIAIEAAFVGMDSATLQRAKRFRSRIEAIIQANGEYIE